MIKRLTIEIHNRRRPTTTLAEWQSRQDEIDRTLVDVPDYFSLQDGIYFPCGNFPCLPENDPIYISYGEDISDLSIIGQEDIIFRTSGSQIAELPIDAEYISDVWLDGLHTRKDQYTFSPDSTVIIAEPVLPSTVIEVKYVSLA